jgi:hypothetical protein
MKNAPPWLADFQGCFGDVLRTPLDRSRGVLESRLPAFWEELGVLSRSHRSAALNLGDYHRQYWFRLFTVLQNDFPLTSRLMGAWIFNEWAASYLLEIPPRDYDLAKVRLHFVPFLQQAGLSPMILQAAALDGIRTDVFMAPASRPWEGCKVETEDPGSIQLVAAADWRIFHEDWALVDLCLRLPQLSGQEELADPPQESRSWLIQRDEKGLVHRRLPEAQARLYELLSQKRMQDAIADWESAYAGDDAGRWQEWIQNWMGQSVSWGLWTEGS